MTDQITIPRALLEQALDAIQELEHASTAVADKKARDAKSNIRAALSAPATAPDEIERLRKDAERNPMHEGEIQAAWLGHGIEEPMPYTFELGIRSAERFNGIKGTP